MQTLKQRMILSKGYSHEPNHFRFTRRMDSLSPIEDCGRGDSVVGWVCVVLALVLMFL